MAGSPPAQRPIGGLKHGQESSALGACGQGPWLAWPLVSDGLSTLPSLSHHKVLTTSHRPPRITVRSDGLITTMVLWARGPRGAISLTTNRNGSRSGGWPGLRNHRSSGGRLCGEQPLYQACLPFVSWNTHVPFPPSTSCPSECLKGEAAWPRGSLRWQEGAKPTTQSCSPPQGEAL